MKAVICIPHYFRPLHTSEGHGSQRIGARERRVRALHQCLWNLDSLFGDRALAARHHKFDVVPAQNPCAMDLNVVVVTIGADHLLDEVQLPPRFRHLSVEGTTPPFLGFAIHQILSSFLGQYDYYCYLEDDVIIEDPLFFEKYEYFNKFCASQGQERWLLQPQRYESALEASPGQRALASRVYGDFALAKDPEGPRLAVPLLGREFHLAPSTGSNAGAYFLTDRQLRLLQNRPNWGRVDSLHCTPLDTSAYHALATTFTIFKPTLDSAPYLTLRHAHPVVFEQMDMDENGTPRWNHPGKPQDPAILAAIENQ